MPVKSLRILVVADDTRTRDLLRANLSEIPWVDAADRSIDCCAPEPDSRQRLKAGNYDVTFVAFGEQSSSAAAAVRGLARHAPGTPIVALTARKDPAGETELLLAGASDCVPADAPDPVTLSLALARALSARPARRELETQLRHAQRMEVVGRLATGIAHDFNNLLTTMLGYIELLAEQLSDRDPRRRELGEIRRAADRASSLTGQLLAFSRREPALPAATDVNVVIGGLREMLRRLIGEHIALFVLAGDDTGSVLADAGHLEQVVMNLVVNARDAMPRGGLLTIETSRVDLDDAAARTRGGSPGSYARLSVSDDGTGMTAEVKARLFEPFFTTKEAGRGTGLGLAIVHTIVQQYGGFITVASELGRGTTCEVFFPRIGPPEAGADDTGAPQPAACC